MCSSVTTRPVSAFRLLAILGVASCLAACARPQLETSQVYQGPRLPPPSRILVYDLAVAPGEVRLDQGVSARLMAAAQGGSRTEQEMVAGRQVVAAISNSAVKELRNRGLPAERAVGSPAGVRGNDVLVEGQLISIDEGNRTERNIVGLGAGRSDVQADVQILYKDPRRAPFMLVTYEGASRSGYKPGMAESMGVGAIGGHLAAAAAVGAGASMMSETYGANVQADAERMGKDIANKLAQYFASQGWL